MTATIYFFEIARPAVCLEQELEIECKEFIFSSSLWTLKAIQGRGNFGTCYNHCSELFATKSYNQTPLGAP